MLNSSRNVFQVVPAFWMRRSQAPCLNPFALARCQALPQGGGSRLKVTVWERVRVPSVIGGGQPLRRGEL